MLSKKNLFEDKITQINEADCFYNLEGNLIQKEKSEKLFSMVAWQLALHGQEQKALKKGMKS